MIGVMSHLSINPIFGSGSVVSNRVVIPERFNRESTSSELMDSFELYKEMINDKFPNKQNNTYFLPPPGNSLIH